MPTALDSFPDLPVDIARRILETAAVHDTNDACRLVLVSKMVHTWIEPLIYQYIVIDSLLAARRFTAAFRLRDRDARTFIARCVKQLCVYYNFDYEGQDLSCLLDIAIDAASIMWWCKTTALLPYIDRLHPEYFSCADLALITEDTLFPRSITHLNIIFRSNSVAEDLSAQSYKSLWRNVFARCPFLTHIMMGFYLPNPPPGASYFDGDFVQSVLSNAPSTFKALIIELKTFEGPTLGWTVSDFSASLEDPRFVIVGPECWFSNAEGVTCYETGPDWDYWAYVQGRHIWEFADAELRARASKAARDASKK